MSAYLIAIRQYAIDEAVRRTYPFGLQNASDLFFDWGVLVGHDEWNRIVALVRAEFNRQWMALVREL